MAKRVLILGGGFGGIHAARELERKLGTRSDVELTIVNSENFFLFTPLLHEVAAGDVQLSHIVSPIRQLVKRTTFLQGDVIAIDLEKKRVSVRHCAGQEIDDLEYDYLLIGVGSTSNFFGLPGVQEHALTMKSLKDAVYLRNAIIASLEEAEFDATTGKQRPLLTYVVAGAGFAGIETVAAMNDFIKEALKFYPHLKKGYGEDRLRRSTSRAASGIRRGPWKVRGKEIDGTRNRGEAEHENCRYDGTWSRTRRQLVYSSGYFRLDCRRITTVAGAVIAV